MARKLDKILVVDIEATCWQGDPPAGQINEIIEVGICLLDIKTYEITANRGIIVKPENSKISPFCTELTTITQEMVDYGITLKEACAILENDYESGQRVWCSYGAYDLKQFTKECASKDVKYPFGQSYLNVKTLFAVMNQLKKEVGMAKALNIAKIELEGTHHRGVDDARNIAKILGKLLSK
jgi:inhibitor of KinA sporulation pathway (predicted exonuclease)